MEAILGVAHIVHAVVVVIELNLKYIKRRRRKRREKKEARQVQELQELLEKKDPWPDASSQIAGAPITDAITTGSTYSPSVRSMASVSTLQAEPIVCPHCTCSRASSVRSASSVRYRPSSASFDILPSVYEPVNEY